MIPIPGTKHILGGDDVFIIAEIGKNFIQTEEDRSVEEYIENAKTLVDAAVSAGADAVKFQTHEVEDEVYPINFTSPHFKNADRLSWVGRNTAATPLEEFWKPLKKHCEERGILFFSTPMSRGAAEKLNELEVPLWKVGSADVEDHVLLDYISRTGKPVIISCGMVSLAELDEVVDYITNRGVPTALLYCISQYPAPAESFNLGTIEHLKEKYPDVAIGFSDHSIGSILPLAAVKLGAKIVEKHFTLDRGLWGADHKASATPEEFREMVSAIRKGEYEKADAKKFYGVKEKELEGANNKYRPYFNKSLVAGCDIPAGAPITKEMVYAMRPVMHIKGLPANSFHDILGGRVNAGLKKYDPITNDLLM